jgi:hypothetical protein
MENNYFKSGDWNVLCEICGFKFKASELKETWDNKRVCVQDFEVRHPLDLIRAPKPEKALPWTRPEPTNQFVTVSYISESVGHQETTIPSGTFNTSTL